MTCVFPSVVPVSSTDYCAVPPLREYITRYHCLNSHSQQLCAPWVLWRVLVLVHLLWCRRIRTSLTRRLTFQMRGGFGGMG
jgi:hypothetical protein